VETELLRTFIEVYRMRSFTRAAQNLSITPSAVSARVRQLEREVGRTLLSRNSQGVKLTPAGERMLRHAVGIVEAMDRAQRHVALEDRAPVTVAGVASFWDLFLQEWLHRVRLHMPQIAPWVEVSSAVRIAERLAQGEVQLGFLYSPPQIPDLTLREVRQVELVLVSSRPGQGVDETLAAGYVLMDWGTVFNSDHNRYFRHRPPAAARSNSGRVAHRLLLACGGGAYLPRALVEADLAAGRLFVVPDAPVFEMRAYAAHLAHGEQRELLEQMLAYA
jgi:LysR family transcriptional regulator, flagellar master operon regulator